ncbi:MAG: PKD domain-containing protein [Flavobacteriales bacterium]|nr:PKD domain-containing protein [Flavobacteriales bacterium]
MSSCIRPNAVIRDLTLSYTTAAANFTSPDPSRCPGEVVQFNDASINAPTSHSWSFPGGMPETSTLPNPVVQYTAPGTYPVSLTVVTTDGESSVTVEDFVTIHQLPIANAGADEFVCEGGSIDLQASGGGTYVWSPIESLSDATIAAPTASPQETTTYTVLVTSTQGCQANDQVVVTVVPLPVPEVVTSSLCAGDSLELTASGADFYTWTPNLFISSTSGASVTVWPPADQSWTVAGTDLYGCTGVAEVAITVVPAATPPSITWGDMALTSTAATSYQWYLDGEEIPGATEQTLVPAMNGDYSMLATDANGCTAESEPFYFGSVGMQEASDGGMRVYPQPAKGVLYLAGARVGAPYRLLDAQGRVVLQGMFQTTTATVDIRELAPGMHVLEAGNEAPLRVVVE